MDHPPALPSPSFLFTPVDRRTGVRLQLWIAEPIPGERRWRRTVRDLATGKRYRAWSKSCGLPDCHCDAYAEELPD